MSKQKIDVNALTKPERLELCKHLIKAGYTVRLGRERPEGKKQYNKFLEYWVEN